MKKNIIVLVLLVWILNFAATANSQVTISGASGGINGSYLSLSGALLGAFNAINGGGSQTGNNIVITITANTAETGDVALLEGNWNSITISPDGHRTMSGISANGIIRFGGADRVTIDGLNTATHSLAIRNASIATLAFTSTISFVNGSCNNTVRNCLITGSAQNLIGIAGGVIFFGGDALTANGNDNNEIITCNIGNENLLPTKCISAVGSTGSDAVRNSGNKISSCNIYNFFGDGLGSTAGICILSGNDNWTIENNRIYQTDPRTFLVSLARYSGILINTVDRPGSFTISGNRIGYAGSTGTGSTVLAGLSNEFRGIDVLTVNETAVTTVTGNIITAIVQGSAVSGVALSASGFIGIAMGTVNGRVNATYNVIGSMDGTTGIFLNYTSVTVNSAPVIGILNLSSHSTMISYNVIGHITIQGIGTMTGFTGIAVSTFVGRQADIQENVITNITDHQAGAYAMIGIQTIFTNANIYLNTIRIFRGNSILAGTAIAGIVATGSTGVNVVEKNRVSDLSNTDLVGVAGGIYGIDVNFPQTANEVKQNKVWALAVESPLTAYQIYGIVRRPGGSGRCYNNMVSLGLRPNGTSITTGFAIVGIRDIGGPSGSFNYYFNSVFVGGTSVLTSVFSSFCFYSDEIVTPREIKNNIFWNARSNAIILGAPHFAIAVGGEDSPFGLNSDYNDLYCTGIDGFVGLYELFPRNTLADWQFATWGEDQNSSSAEPDFVNPATGNLYLGGASTGDEAFLGTPIEGITTDIDKNERHPEFPYMGAHETPTALPVELASFTYSLNGRNVNLSWVTSSELNNAGFDIQRKTTEGEWTHIANVPGYGTSNEQHSYSFTDRNLNAGKFKYRLKQIDMNGHFKYYDLNTEIFVSLPEAFDLSQNYPNPFNPSTKINFDLPFDSKVSLKIFDITGREVADLVNETKAAGYYTVSFNASALSSGMYFYRINAEGNGQNFVETKKMMLIR